MKARLRKKQLKRKKLKIKEYEQFIKHKDGQKTQNTVQEIEIKDTQER